MKPNDTLLNYEKGKLCEPEILNNDSKNIYTNTDVFVLGKLATTLIFNNRINLEVYLQEMYISYNLNLFDINLPIEIHSFLGKTTSMLKESRFDSIKSCNKNLSNIIKSTEKRSIDKEKKFHNLIYCASSNFFPNKVN